MSYGVHFFKDRQKFSAAHFTIFADGAVERLHGHNYTVSVRLKGSVLQKGLLFPFHKVKPLIVEQCVAWDERVLLPDQSPFVQLKITKGQCDVALKTAMAQKHYSFPEEDIRLLKCDNISCENLARLFTENLAKGVAGLKLPLEELEVTIGEGAGQTVSYRKILPGNEA